MKGTFEQLTGRYETVLASDSESKVRLLSVLIVDGGWSLEFLVEGHGPNKEFGSLTAACREYDARVAAGDNPSHSCFDHLEYLVCKSPTGVVAPDGGQEYRTEERWECGICGDWFEESELEVARNDQ